MNNKLAIFLAAVAIFLAGLLLGDILCAVQLNDLEQKYYELSKQARRLSVLHTNLTKVVFEVGEQRDKAWEELDKSRHTHDPGKLTRQDLNTISAQEELTRAIVVKELEQFMSTNRFYTR